MKKYTVVPDDERDDRGVFSFEASSDEEAWLVLRGYIYTRPRTAPRGPFALREGTRVVARFSGVHDCTIVLPGSITTDRG